jgi:hypothetical protein
MTTTLHDYGRHSEKYGDIGFYYAFNFRFWFGEHQIAPDDVLTWCRNNCVGYYKVKCYTHKDSKRVSPRSKDFANKVVYADVVYLADEADAMRIRLKFDVKDTQVKRPKIKPLKRARRAKNVSVAKS